MLFLPSVADIFAFHCALFAVVAFAVAIAVSVVAAVVTLDGVAVC